MMDINSYFDNTYLLNLFKRSDRRDRSTNKLNLHSIDHDVFNGVDGSVMDHLWSKLNNPYFTNPSYLGCSLSHLSIYKDAIEKGYDRILITEDDNLINKDINFIFNSLDIPTWTDLFYLGYIPLSDDCSMWDYRFGINQSNIISDKFFCPSNLWGLFAYGISRDLMIEMVDVYNKEFPMEIDRYFVNYIQKRGNSIAISPQLFCCDDGIPSDNLGLTPSNMKAKSVDSRFISLDNYI